MMAVEWKQWYGGTDIPLSVWNINIFTLIVTPIRRLVVSHLGPKSDLLITSLPKRMLTDQQSLPSSKKFSYPEITLVSPCMA